MVCLEQGRWHDRSEYRGTELDWELTARRQWSGSPNVRGLPEDYPVDDTDSDLSPLMFAGVGGSMLLFAGAWPRLLPSDFRVRSLDGVADDWPLTYDELRPYYERNDRHIGVSGLGGDPAYPPGEDPPLPPLPIGPGALKVARAHDRLGWHWWPEPNAILSAPYDGRHQCVQRGTCMQGCNEGAKASTDLTHWPHALANGARLVTGARVMRIETELAGLATGAVWIDDDGREHFQAASVVVLAANAIGTARLLLLSSSDVHPDGLANSSGLVGTRLMMHPFAQRVGTLRRRPGELAGAFRLLDRIVRVLRDRRAARVRSRREMGPGAHWRSDQRRLAESRRRAGVGARPSPPDAGPIRARRELGALRRRPARSGQSRDAVVLVTDSSGVPAPELHYKVSPNSRRLLDFHIDKASESMLAAGAHTVEVDRLMRYSGWHLLGTARMGDDPATSVVDRWNRSHDVANLYVVDGSCFVTSGGVNPTSSICALALRAADHIVRDSFPTEGAR